MTANLVGQTVANQFRVDAFIASGGMGTVFRVWDLERNVPLAMKVLHADLAEDQAILERFQREARALWKLEHPNIIPFYGLYQTPSHNLLLQLYIDGPTLKDIFNQLSGNILPTSDLLCIMKSLCSALGYAHNNNVIHCDVKPANVMIDRGGKVYLGDFGIARHAESDVTALPGAGSPAYMAPEQITSNSVTKETDIYALGVLLFELLTGQRPFRGSEKGTEKTGNSINERIRYAHVNLPRPDPRQFNPGISPQLAAVVLRALEKDPARRFSSCQELLNSLSAAMGVVVDQIPDRISLAFFEKVPTSPMLLGDLLGPVIPQRSNKPQISQKSKPGNMLFVFIGVAVLLISMIVLSTNKSPKPIIHLSDVPPRVEATSAPALFQNTANAAPTKGPDPTQLPLPTVTRRQVEPTSTRIPPTDTPEVIPDFPIYYPVGNCPGSRLHVGDSAYVPYGEGKISLRSEPVGKIGDTLIRKLDEGEVVHILGGPVCDLGLLLWEVRTVQDEFGWLPEGDSNNYWILPVNTEQVCTGLKPTRLWIGARAYVEPMPKDRNILFSEPNNANELGRMNPGSFMQIIEGPRCGSEGIWWYVYSEQLGIRGWTRECGKTSSFYFIAPVIPRP